MSEPLVRYVVVEVAAETDDKTQCHRYCQYMVNPAPVDFDKNRFWWRCNLFDEWTCEWPPKRLRECLEATDDNGGNDDA
jgi:hypothetical protein